MSEPKLSREIGVFGAVMLGLGSIIGTGAFVAIGIAAGVAGSFLIVSILIASGLALCNALSSAQLAANHPVSGGTYEYGRKYLNNLTGFIAGWLFVCAKSASAAAAAMGFSGYLLSLFDLNSSFFLTFGALATVVVLSIVVFTGIKKTNSTNAVIVLITLVALLVFILFGGLSLSEKSIYNIDIGGRFSDEFLTNTIFYGSALMFVAFTGYGRIATLGEEVKNPRVTIPKSIVITLLISTFLYLFIGIIGLKILTPEGFAKVSEGNLVPLRLVAKVLNSQWLLIVISVGAITAMLGVLLNLILGVSRVIFAMGRNGDLPTIVSRVKDSSPTYAVTVSALLICFLVIVGDIKTTWSLSAFTVLLYYSITNLSALKLPEDKRFFPKWIAILGLAGCLVLSIYVDLKSLLIGSLLLLIGLIWFLLNSRIKFSR